MSKSSKKVQNPGMDKLPKETDNTDKLLSDKYILAKDIRDLNKTLKDSVDRMRLLEEELKNKLKLKEKLELYTLALDEIMKEPTSKNKASIVEKWIADSDLIDIQESLRNIGKDSDRIKLLLIDNSRTLTDEINLLEEKINDRKNVHSDALVERDHLKAQMKEILEEFAGHKL